MTVVAALRRRAPAERGGYSNPRNIPKFTTSSRMSSDFGVSNTIGRPRQRSSRNTHRNASTPTKPFPICSCRSTREPSSFFESFK